jgi:hypothetical protein
LLSLRAYNANYITPLFKSRLFYVMENSIYKLVDEEVSAIINSFMDTKNVSFLMYNI